MPSKINHLLATLPPGGVATSAWLRAQGIDRNLMQRYLRSGWFRCIGAGAYVRKADTPEWPGAVWALQQAEQRVWPGGLSALALLGYGQNVALGSGATLWLFGESKSSSLPKWFRDGAWQVRPALQCPDLFQAELDSASTFKSHTLGELTLRISCVERAVFEVAYGVHDAPDFEALLHAMEGLMTLRPKIMQALLTHCRSIKIARLVLLLGEHLQQPWVSRVDFESVDLGHGKRQLWPDGAMHAKYRITVPKGFGDEF